MPTYLPYAKPYHPMNSPYSLHDTMPSEEEFKILMSDLYQCPPAALESSFSRIALGPYRFVYGAFNDRSSSSEETPTIIEEGSKLGPSAPGHPFLHIWTLYRPARWKGDAYMDDPNNTLSSFRRASDLHKIGLRKYSRHRALARVGASETVHQRSASEAVAGEES